MTEDEEENIVKEAERIIENTRAEKKEKNALFPPKTVSYFIGMLSGCAVSYGTYILISFFF